MVVVMWGTLLLIAFVLYALDWYMVRVYRNIAEKHNAMLAKPPSEE